MSSPRVAPMPRRKGVRNYIKLCFERNAVTSMVGCTCFCMVTDFWYIVVMPKNLAVRSPIMGCFFFSRTFFLSAAGPPKFRWFKPAKSKGKVHERKPLNQRGKSKVARPHLPGSRLGLVGAASGWARSCPRGGRTPSPLASPSAGNESKEAAKACMPAWARMADQRLMSEVTVACCNGAGADRALCCARRRRNSADS